MRVSATPPLLALQLLARLSLGQTKSSWPIGLERSGVQAAHLRPLGLFILPAYTQL